MSFSTKHLFFDLDRTIWDFDNNSIAALKEIIKNEKLDSLLLDFDTFHSVYKSENAKLWEEYGKGKIDKQYLRYARFENTLIKFSLNNPDLAKRFGDAYVEISPMQTLLIPGARAVIQELKKMGFSLHIITNGFKEVQMVKLKNCKLDTYFDKIICSEDIGINKPNPAIFLHARKLAAAHQEDCIMIGDDYLADIHGAVMSGMQAIFYNPENRKNYSHEHEIVHMDELISKILYLL